VNVEEDPIWRQAVVDLFQGVDHALNGNASQGVGENGRVKRFVVELRL
jgi:hypothetical protein